jgi:carboxylesterase type B
MDLLRSGKHQGLPVIVGTTGDEFTTMAEGMLPHQVGNEEEYLGAITSYFASISSVVPPAAIYGTYPSTTYPSRKDAMIALVSDYVYTCPARMVARALAMTQKGPVRRFIYKHVFTSPGWGQFRAAHGFDLTLLFGPLPEKLALHFDPAEQALADEVLQSCVQFANTGSPLTAVLAEWPLYDPAQGNYLILDTPPRLASEFRKTECGFWDIYQSGLYP